MRKTALVLGFGSLLAGTALATEPVDPTTTAADRIPAQAQRTPAGAQVLDALESQAEVPATPPTLPDSASDRARQAHAETAFGKRGAAAREAAQAARDEVSQQVREEARSRSLTRAREATAGNANADRGLSTAEAARANAQSAAAAGRARAEDARGNAPIELPGGAPDGIPGNGGPPSGVPVP